MKMTKHLCPQGAGVDVVIAIFCDFCQFSAEKWEFFSKAK
jgi:hypothetical protein